MRPPLAAARPALRASRATARAALAVALLVACGETTRPTVPPPPVPADVLVAPVDTLRSLGATATLAATVRDARGAPIVGATLAGWTSADPAVVAVDARTGVVTGVANGETTVTVVANAAGGAATGSVRVVVRQRLDLARSTVAVARPLLFVDDTVRVTLTLRDALGAPIRTERPPVALTVGDGLRAGPMVDLGDGVYTSDVVGTAVGPERAVAATVGGAAVASAPTLRVVGFTKLAVQSLGDALSCGILTTGDLHCWGTRSGAARGTGRPDVAPRGATLVAGGHRWLDVDVHAHGGCGITTERRLRCWGEASQLMVGNGATGGLYPLPVPVLPESTVVAVDLGSPFGACAITTGRTAMCWSFGSGGRLGDGGVEPAAVPVAVRGDHRFVAIATSYLGTCGVTEAGAMLCWGSAQTLGTGFGPFAEECGTAFPCARTPVRVAGDHLFRPIVARGGNEVCGITVTDRVVCWGMWGEQVPTPVPGAPPMTAIAVGDLDACGVAPDGRALCWGTNRNGRFGTPANAAAAHRVPEPVAGGRRFTQLTMGQHHTCGLAPDGNAWCWGGNAAGELGDGTTTPSALPVRVRLFAP